LKRGELTRLLVEWRGGRSVAAERLAEAVHAELRKLARAYLRREPSEQTLSPTALINEAYLRLIDQRHVHWQNRAHFFGIAAQCMRRVLVDHARRRRAAKRCHGMPVTFVDDLAWPHPDVRTADDLAEALEGLAKLDARQAQIVELRFFGGFSIDEVAASLDISPATVKRDWLTARLWLKRELTRNRQAPHDP